MPAAKITGNLVTNEGVTSFHCLGSMAADQGANGGTAVTPLSKIIRSSNIRSVDVMNSGTSKPNAIGFSTSDYQQKSTVTPTNGIHNSESDANSAVYQYGTAQYTPIASSGTRQYQSPGLGEATYPQKSSSSGGWYSRNDGQQQFCSQYRAMPAMGMNPMYYPTSYQNYSPPSAPGYYMGANPYYASPQSSQAYTYFPTATESANANNCNYIATAPPGKCNSSSIESTTFPPIHSCVNTEYHENPTTSPHTNANTSVSPENGYEIQHKDKQEDNNICQHHDKKEEVQVIKNEDEQPLIRLRVESDDEESSDDESCHLPTSKLRRSTTSAHAPQMPPPHPPVTLSDVYQSYQYGYVHLNQCKKIHIDKKDSSNMALDGILRSDFKMPEFHKLINFRNAPNPLPKKTADEMTCVMCGIEMPYKRKKENSKAGHFIPIQNKGLCTGCDISVWKIQKSGHLIRWCKGCKNFKPWKSFGDRSFLTKCVLCRNKQKDKYMKRKTEGKKYKGKQIKDKGANEAKAKDQGLSYLIAATVKVDG